MLRSRIIDKGSISVNGINMADYITSAHFGYHKLWANGSGRNAAMETTGTFNIFPKITIILRKLTQDELEILSPIFNSLFQTTTYYDPDLKAINTISTYTNDFEYDSKIFTKVEGISIAFISRKRRLI